MTKNLWIGGAWMAAQEGNTLEVVNPCNEEVIAKVSAATAPDVEAAVCAAQNAFVGWRQTTGQERAKHLRQIADGVRAQREDLARLEVQQNGKPLPEALWDMDDVAACFDYYAGLAEALETRQNAPIALPHPDFVSKVRLEPVGVVAAIVPWNYPLLMAAWKVAPALAAGCCVVLKPSELTPLTALKLAQISQEAGVPAGVLNILPGLGASAGAALVSHPGVSKIAFTGSVATGSRIMGAASATITNTTLELGGKSPILVFDDADLGQALEWVLFGIFWNKGEVCSATSRLLVQAGIASRFLERLKLEAERVTVGDPMEEGVLLGPLVSKGQHEKVLGFIEEGKRLGVPLLTGGQRPAHTPKGFFLAPTVFTDVPTTSRLWQEEIFGPVLSVRTFQSEQEALALANDSHFGLGAAIMSKDEARLERVAAQLEAGIVWQNCSQPTFCEAPWGGMKRSGIGRELGQWGLDNYLEVKQVTRYTSDNAWGWYLK